MIERAEGASLNPEALQAIVSRCDGVPLFLEETTSAFLETGGDAVPAPLRDSLTARLDRLKSLRNIVQIAAAIGF